MTDTDELKPEDLQEACQRWQAEHGKLDETNFMKCIAHFTRRQDLITEDFSNLISHVIELAGVEHCDCCRAIPAKPKDVNGTVHILCSRCRESVLFQELGPREGYV